MTQGERLPFSGGYPETPTFLKRRIEAYEERLRLNGTHILKGRQPHQGAILMVSNDYLALTQHPYIIQAEVHALREGGHGLLRSDAFRQGKNPLRTFETELAELIGHEDSALTQSGWCANIGLIQTIAERDVPVYIDMLAHASFWQGILDADAHPRPFRHNSADNLEKLMKRHGPGVVVIESVYSTHGDIAPLEDIAHLARRYGSLLVVDESHSLGVFGKRGEGLVAALGLTDQVDYLTASLSKAYAARGGMISGKARHLEYFRYESRPAIFSSAVLPYEAEGFLATLYILEQAQDRRMRLMENTNHLREGLLDLGFPVQVSQSQIIPLIAGPEKETIILRDALEHHGIFGSVFCHPATARNGSLIRFSVNSELTPQELDRVLDVCEHIRPRVNPYNWPVARREKTTAA